MKSIWLGKGHALFRDNMFCILRLSGILTEGTVRNPFEAVHYPRIGAGYEIPILAIDHYSLALVLISTVILAAASLKGAQLCNTTMPDGEIIYK
ncbi:MAG: hypothetical protein ACO30O_11715, partial [bacterium]